MQHTRSRSYGFTLIELLVVIAIIGVLSSVVLASLNTARNKGTNAAIKANLSGARAEAEIYYDTNGNYTAVCSAAANGILDNATAAQKAIGSTVAVTVGAVGSPTVLACNHSATGWAMQAPMTGSVYFCVDSNGAALESASSMITATTDILCS
jgi:type IV pilus assembly protein PilE